MLSEKGFFRKHIEQAWKAEVVWHPLTIHREPFRKGGSSKDGTLTGLNNHSDDNYKASAQNIWSFSRVHQWRPPRPTCKTMLRRLSRKPIMDRPRGYGMGLRAIIPNMRSGKHSEGVSRSILCHRFWIRARMELRQISKNAILSSCLHSNFPKWGGEPYANRKGIGER